MKTLIIPDIHTKYKLAESIINREKPDRIVFLGDYFDDFYESFDTTDKTAKWLADSLQEKNRIHLVGNHDLNYFNNNPKIKCSGYEHVKHEIIDYYKIQWRKLEPFCWVDDWLCTHAGFSDTLYRDLTDSLSVSKIIEESRKDLENIDDENYEFRFLNAGAIRGGTATTGGIVWCDYSEFVDIPGIKQIFGHTRGNKVRRVKSKDSEHICLDTVLQNYAVHENHVMTVKKVTDLKE